MKTTTITATEYAKLFGCTPRNVQMNCAKGVIMPFVVSFKKSEGTWLLTVLISWYESKNK
jgi:hypothetical protein